MTPDRETLIHAIELRENIAKRDHHGFVDLPYEMVGNVLAMLKEQEAKNVVDMRLSPDWFRIASCPKCNELLKWVYHRNHCGYCGQAVKWE